jgi:hypothetical protein
MREGAAVTGLVGLGPGQRYRCAACGNLTRFDVETVERVRRFWHADLAGDGRIDEEERAEVEIHSVTCRWCGSTRDVEVVAAPAAAATEGAQSER